MLKKTFFPKHGENRMCHEGDTQKARNDFLMTRFNNLNFLLKQRYGWMNSYIKPTDYVVEIGCGAGLSPLYLHKKPLLTDVVCNEWVDKVIDATSMAFENELIDVIIASHCLHHMYNPMKFFQESMRVLRVGGRILIQEIQTSLMMRVLLRGMRHEGYSYDIDVFSDTEIANDCRDIWSANCAIPQLLFENSNNFEQKTAILGMQWKIIKNEVCEGLIFPLSGGVISKTRVPEIKSSILSQIAKIDSLLIRMLPSVFALGRRVVIEKKPFL